MPLDQFIIQSEKEAFTPTIVKKSFEVVGLWPFKIEVMKEKVKKFLDQSIEKNEKIENDPMTERIKKIHQQIVDNDRSMESTTTTRTNEKVIQRMSEVYSVAQLKARTLQKQKEKKEKLEKKEELKKEKMKMRLQKQREREEKRKQFMKKRQEKLERKTLNIKQSVEERLKKLCSLCHRIYKKGKGWYLCVIFVLVGKFVEIVKQLTDLASLHTSVCKKANISSTIRSTSNK